MFSLEWWAGFAFLSKFLALREMQNIDGNLPEEFNLPQFSLFQVLWQTCGNLKQCCSSFGLLFLFMSNFRDILAYLNCFSSVYCSISWALLNQPTGSQELILIWKQQVKPTFLSAAFCCLLLLELMAKVEWAVNWSRKILIWWCEIYQHFTVIAFEYSPVWMDATALQLSLKFFAFCRCKRWKC